MNLSRRQFVRAAGAIALGLAGSGALAGCGSTGSGSTSGSESSKLATIKDRGTLNCGVKKDIPGYGYLDPATGKYRGMEIDLCYQVAAKVFGCSYEQAKSDDLVAFTDVTPKTRGPLIDNDQLDMICATYTITDERKQSWDFTRAYRSDYIGLLVKKGKFKGLRDLDGKYIGVSQGSSTKQAIQDMLKDKGLDVSPTFLQFPDYSTLKIALDSGSIDVFSVGTAPSWAATKRRRPWSSRSPTSNLASRSTGSRPRRAATSHPPATRSWPSACPTVGSTRRSRTGTCCSTAPCDGMRDRAPRAPACVRRNEDGYIRPLRAGSRRLPTWTCSGGVWLHAQGRARQPCLGAGAGAPCSDLLDHALKGAQAINRVYVSSTRTRAARAGLIFMYAAGPLILQRVTGASDPVRIASFTLGTLGVGLYHAAYISEVIARG